MKYFNYSINAFIPSSIIIVFLTVSCTRDRFWGIEEDYGDTDYMMLEMIANSKEFIEFKKQSILAWEEMNNIDTTKKVLVDTYKGYPVYAFEEQGSIKILLDANRKLMESYPEYKKLNTLEKQQVLSLSIMNNRSFRNFVSKHNYSFTIKTKGNNGETDAYKWMMTSPNIPQNAEGPLGGYIMNSSSIQNIWYINDDYWVSICEAIYLANGEHKEHGGYCWDSDGSGIRVLDINREEGRMHKVYLSGTTPLPTFDFHIHPSGNLSASSEDYDSWIFMTGVYHRIYDLNGNYKSYPAFLIPDY